MKRFSLPLALLLCLAAQAVEPGSTAGKDFDDPLILARVRAALATHDDAVIHIEICRGVVQLTGIVGSDPERNEAELAVMAVAGVRDIRNHLVIEPELLESGETRRARLP